MLMSVPFSWKAVVALSVPVAVTTEPDSVRIESVMLPMPLKRAIFPLVPEPVMPPPVPTQLPRLKRQTVSVVPPAITGI